MAAFTMLVVEDVTLAVSRCDWVTGRIVAERFTGTDASRLRPLLEVCRQRARKHYTLHHPGEEPLHFAGFLTDYHCMRLDDHLIQHTVTVVMDGPLWREDDTLVEGVNAYDRGSWAAFHRQDVSPSMHREY